MLKKCLREMSNCEVGRSTENAPNSRANDDDIMNEDSRYIFSMLENM